MQGGFPPASLQTDERSEAGLVKRAFNSAENKLKQRLKEEGNESVTNCNQLKLEAADGKKYLTDVAGSKHVLRLVQSILSKSHWEALPSNGAILLLDERKGD